MTRRHMRGSILALREELTKADCARRKVAAVIYNQEGQLLGRGHNRLPLGSCLDGQCPRGKLSYDEQPKDVGYEESGCDAVHAEVMAISSVPAWEEGLIMYVTELPCAGCQDAIYMFRICEVRLLHPDKIGRMIAPV